METEKQDVGKRRKKKETTIQSFISNEGLKL